MVVQIWASQTLIPSLKLQALKYLLALNFKTPRKMGWMSNYTNVLIKEDWCEQNGRDRMGDPQLCCCWYWSAGIITHKYIPACASSSPAFHTMDSAYTLKKQGDNIQSWHKPFPIWNQSVVPCPVLTAASSSAYRFHRWQVRWSGILSSFKNFPQLIVIHTVKGFGIVNKADVFLELSCFFYDPMNAGNLITGSSGFSKYSLNIWKFTVHVLLKPCLENFEYYFASVWNECNCAVDWTFFGIALLWIEMKTDLF